MLAIKRVEDILAGKRVVHPQAPPPLQQHQHHHHQPTGATSTYMNPLVRTHFPKSNFKQSQSGRVWVDAFNWIGFCSSRRRFMHHVQDHSPPSSRHQHSTTNNTPCLTPTPSTITTNSSKCSWMLEQVMVTHPIPVGEHLHSNSIQTNTEDNQFTDKPGQFSHTSPKSTNSRIRLRSTGSTIPKSSQSMSRMEGEGGQWRMWPMTSRSMGRPHSYHRPNTRIGRDARVSISSGPRRP